MRKTRCLVPLRGGTFDTAPGRRAVGRALHGSARATEAIRRTIQARRESVRAVAERHGIGPTTVRKWCIRETVTDARMGPKEPRSAVPGPEAAAVIVAFRRHTLPPLDVCRYAHRHAHDVQRASPPVAPDGTGLNGRCSHRSSPSRPPRRRPPRRAAGGDGGCQSSPVRNCARPWPNDQSSSVLATSETTTSADAIPHRSSRRSQSKR